MFSVMFHYACALVESELLVLISSTWTELRKDDNSYFLNSNLDTRYSLHNVSFNFFIHAMLMVKEFDLLRPVYLHFIFISMVEVPFFSIEQSTKYAYK